MKTTPSGIPMIDARVPGFIEHLEHALSDLPNICDRSRPYDGQDHTSTGVRGRHLVQGLTMRDVRDCLLMALVDATPQPDIDDFEAFKAHRDEHGQCADPHCSRPWCKLERGELTGDDLYKLDLSQVDPIAIAQNLCCRLEKAMGIFPNVPERGGEDLLREMLDAAGIDPPAPDGDVR